MAASAELPGRVGNGQGLDSRATTGNRDRKWLNHRCVNVVPVERRAALGETSTMLYYGVIPVVCLLTGPG